MADFCGVCWPIIWGDPPPGESEGFNDFAWDEAPEQRVMICEDCGVHVFDRAGMPLCGHDGGASAGNPDEPSAFTMTLCAKCVDVAHAVTT